MKKYHQLISFIFVFIILVLMLCSCSSAEMRYSIEKNGITFNVNKQSKTISDGTNTYNYNFTGNDSDYKVDITYPDGSTYWYNMSGYSGYGGWSDDYAPEKYIDGDVLTDVLLEDAPKASKHSGRNLMLIILLIALGIFNIAAPYAVWYLEYGWRYKDAQPSDLALGINRFGGAVAIIIAIIMMFS